MYDQVLIRNLEETSRHLRRNVIISMGVGTAGHLGGSCSSADLIAALYFYKMHHDPHNPQLPDRDRFLLSKGHVAILQYSALAEAGYFPVEDLKTTKAIGSYLQGHPDVRKTPGIEAGTGSLGQGLSIGLGMALGMRLNKIDRRVYVLVGDGELNEGQIWEAAMAAAAYQVSNLVALVDNNTLQATGFIRDRLDSGSIADKWRSFNWNVIEIDGHNMVEILGALDHADCGSGRPTVIIAHTVKGKGVSFAENNPAFHNAALTQEQYDLCMRELS